MSDRRGSLGLNLLLLALSLFFAALVAEGALRLLGHFRNQGLLSTALSSPAEVPEDGKVTLGHMIRLSSNPKIIYEFKPDLDVTFIEAPVSIVVCTDTERWDRGLMDSSIWPAVQNLMTAATAHGLGSALTTIATILADDLREILRLPDTVDPVAVIPIGHPAKSLGSSRREPVEDHAHREVYGDAW